MKNFLKKNLILIIFIVIFLSTSPFTASAYIDPGTGSFIIQVVIAVVLGATYFIKLSWKKIGVFLIKTKEWMIKTIKKLNPWK